MLLETEERVEREMRVHRERERMRLYISVYEPRGVQFGGDSARGACEKALAHFDKTFGGNNEPFPIKSFLCLFIGVSAIATAAAFIAGMAWRVFLWSASM